MPARCDFDMNQVRRGETAAAPEVRAYLSVRRAIVRLCAEAG